MVPGGASKPRLTQDSWKLGHSSEIGIQGVKLEAEL